MTLTGSGIARLFCYVYIAVNNKVVSVGLRPNPFVIRSMIPPIVVLFGYPLTVSYGKQGEETWYYTYGPAPAPTAVVPVLKASTPSLNETTRTLAVTFSRDGTVKGLGKEPPPQNPRPSG
jgi:hypothetical protein